jgi:hypothetical protein
MFRALLAHLQEALIVDYVQVAVKPQSARSQHTSYVRNYTKSICAELSEDGRVTPETCRGIDSQ